MEKNTLDEALVEILDIHYYMICKYYKGNRSLAKRKGIYEKTIDAIKKVGKEYGG
jgi:hypothetical protein